MSWVLGALAAALASASSNTRQTPATRTYYRTRDGQADYRFLIERESDGSYRPYIESQPQYGPRSSGPHETHRLSSGGRQYVCWNKPLGSEDDAKNVAAQWADATQEYIKTGRRF
jgi:hypothetical protein